MSIWFDLHHIFMINVKLPKVKFTWKHFREGKDAPVTVENVEALKKEWKAQSADCANLLNPVHFTQHQTSWYERLLGSERIDVWLSSWILSPIPHRNCLRLNKRNHPELNFCPSNLSTLKTSRICVLCFFKTDMTSREFVFFPIFKYSTTLLSRFF